MERINVQKVISQAGEAKLLNLDVSLGELVRSDVFGSLVGYDDPWEIFCGNDLRLFIWPRPRVEGLFFDAQLADSLRESLRMAEGLNQRLAGLNR